MDEIQSKESVVVFINAFAEALNKPDPESISSYYAVDGLFLPNNHATISKHQLEKVKGNFFKKRKFTIEFEINEILIRDNFAFVQAVARANTALADNVSTTTTSRDLFVLGKEGTSWSIYRYMFNSFNPPAGK